MDDGVQGGAGGMLENKLPSLYPQFIRAVRKTAELKGRNGAQGLT